ncbi:MAG: primosomal protein N' [Ignavibacteriales bacterium]|nr:primosomal protein N' [Ignavibacteriales bacterium]
MFAEVAFPLPFRRFFTYRIPEDLVERARFGMRALAPFGKRVITGVIVATKTNAGDIPEEKIKEILDIPDDEPIITQSEYPFYQWIAEYYLCGLGEVIRLAAPYGSDLQSKRTIQADAEICRELADKAKKQDSTRTKILLALAEQPNISFIKLQKKVKKKNIYAIIRKMQLAGIVSVIEENPKAKVKDKVARFIRLSAPVESVYELLPEIERRSKKQAAALLRMIDYRDHGISLKDFVAETKITAPVLIPLVKRGLLALYNKKIERKFTETLANDLPSYTLTEEQKVVYEKVMESINANGFKAFLLHGITGSGKTLIYLDLAEEVLKRGKSVLVLVPEISLTPQITSRFYARFSDKTAVIHSQIAPGERYDTWKAAQAGKIQVIIGARSALFAPLQNLGLVIIDEEHDASFKQDTIPRYNGRDCAIMKAFYAGCPVVLGSATPSVESMYNAINGKYQLLELKERADGAKLPFITMVNVVEEKKQKRMANLFSQSMLDKIDHRLKLKEGVIILQNRRGFSTQVYCFECGQMEMCENCSVAMVHHLNTNIIQCHYCSSQKPAPSQCSHCGSFAIRFFGVGTERVEDELSYYFPNAKMSRIDSDTMAKKGNLSAILQDFRLGNTDILVGTQMVSKGLDFARVTLVCVVSAETNLWLPDFRANERTFQLLTQVAGRAGRSAEKGEVLIQTQNDKHPVLQRVLHHDYAGFYKAEVFQRERLQYPPFTRICLIEMKDKDEKKVRNAITDLYNILLKYKQNFRISAPTTAIIYKLRNEFRYQILLKANRAEDPSGSRLRYILNESLAYFSKISNFKDVNAIVDIDPQHIL